MNPGSCLASLFTAVVFLALVGDQSAPVMADEGKRNPPSEEESARFLNSLQDRCRKMLKMQSEVHTATERLNKIVNANKARPEDVQAAKKLSERQKALVVEATKVVDILEAEGSVIAFTEVFNLVRDDMKKVQRRLEQCDVGAATLALERDIVDTLQEMIDALTRTR